MFKTPDTKAAVEMLFDGLEIMYMKIHYIYYIYTHIHILHIYCTHTHTQHTHTHTFVCGYIYNTCTYIYSVYVNYIQRTMTSVEKLFDGLETLAINSSPMQRLLMCCQMLISGHMQHLL